MDHEYGLKGVQISLHGLHLDQSEIFLISPKGTRVMLIGKKVCTGEKLDSTLFTMESQTSAFKAKAPYKVNVRPVGDLALFNTGEDPNGKWRLTIGHGVTADSLFQLRWSLIFDKEPAVPLEHFGSVLPIFTIQTKQEIPDEPKIEANLKVYYREGSCYNTISDSSLYLKGLFNIELHGASSRAMPKKPFNIETKPFMGMQPDISLPGLPPEHAWVLVAAYSDKSLIRNPLAYTLYREMGHYAPRTRYVELLVNGEYLGIYILTEKIRRSKSRVNIAKSEIIDKSGNLDRSGGYIIKLDGNSGRASSGWASNYVRNKAENPVYFQLAYPQNGEVDYIKNYIDSFETALVKYNPEDERKGYRQYIEVASFIDKMILNEISNNLDGYRRSEYLVKDKGGKLAYGPAWDFDVAWGNCKIVGGNAITYWRYLAPNTLKEHTPIWWEKMMQDKRYRQELSNRYLALRKNVLSTTHINALIDSMAQEISPSVGRNFKKWDIMGIYVWPNPDPLPKSYGEEVAYLKAWISRRLQWMDNQMKAFSEKENPVL